MRGSPVEAAFFCLASGAVLGCLFLACKLFRLMLSLGKVGTAVLDAAFCLFCGGAAFLCALAVDRGRFRFFQLFFQGVGAWAAVESIDPLLSGAARVLLTGLRKLRRFLRFLNRRFWPHVPAKKTKKREKGRRKKGKGAKSEKKHLKNLC